MVDTKYFKQVGGGEFEEIGLLEENFYESIPEGHHYIQRTKGGRSTRYKVDPAFLPVLAVMMECRDEMCEALHRSFQARPTRNESLTEKQAKIWHEFQKEVDVHGISYPSTHEVLDIFMKEVYNKVQELETNPALKEAYGHYMLLAKLTMKEKNETD